MLVTVHVSLRDAIGQVDSGGRGCAPSGWPTRPAGASASRGPRVAVAGLNPHAGEGGLFGDEDPGLIAPGVEAARAEGIDASGPLPGDTVFMRRAQGAFDVVVAQYHDQGLIPVKYLGLDEGVNVTLGLPFVRTSVDHGTAFDIAGKGIADPASLRVAFEQAVAVHQAAAGRARLHLHAHAQ